jgi:GTP-sensing pleiotropic transcriptional regulator CodY
MVVNNSLQAPVAWGQFESQVINLFIHQPVVSEIEDDSRNHTVLHMAIPALTLEEKQQDFCAFQTSLVYTTSSRPARDT